MQEKTIISVFFHTYCVWSPLSITFVVVGSVLIQAFFEKGSWSFYSSGSFNCFSLFLSNKLRRFFTVLETVCLHACLHEIICHFFEHFTPKTACLRQECTNIRILRLTEKHAALELKKKQWSCKYCDIMWFGISSLPCEFLWFRFKLSLKNLHNHFPFHPDSKNVLSAFQLFRVF